MTFTTRSGAARSSSSSSGRQPPPAAAVTQSMAVTESLLPHDLMVVALRLLAATLIGSGIGLDREIRRKPAGLRTHALVSLGAALAVVVVIRVTPISVQYAEGQLGLLGAISRVIQGIIAGVGFLGGGAILKSADHEMV